MGKRWIACAGLWLALASGVSAQDKDWYESEEGGDGEPAAASAGGDEGDAPQEAGEVSAAQSSKRGGWLTPGSFSAYGGVRVGIAGAEHVDRPGVNLNDDLLSTWGLQAGADYVFMDYFALSGELRLGWFLDESSDRGSLGRDLLVDIVAKPRGRYVLESIGLELYGALPVGFTIPSFNDDKGLDGKFSFNLGAGVGATYFFTEHLGINAETMMLWHWARAHATPAATGTSIDATFRLRQFNLFANVVYAF